jgi:gluconokinase
MTETHKSSNTPILVIAMGVSGCGKSTLAEALARQFGFAYVEADDYHSPEAKDLMASGTPLTDEDREPWIETLCQVLLNLQAQGESAVMAYSGLRAAHRQRFRDLGIPLLFLHLQGDKELIRSRMAARSEHFMPTDLLDSQFQSLEATDGESDIQPLSIERSPEAIAQDASQRLRQFMAQG